MEILDLPLTGLKLIRPRIFPDHRGYFLETYQQQRFTNEDLSVRFVQDNLSFSKRGVLRGLHYQYPTWQGKLVFAIQGEIFDVAVDIRRDSPTFGKWHGVVLNDRTHEQLYVPPGFAHGFCVLSETARVMYKCTNYYTPGEEHTLLWNDPDIGIDWPVKDPILADKDAQGKLLKDALIPG
ncbi:MAG: dTDP-4-dehydrorhamnose 3,5-epimerase [Gammaproteobacteria bacterium]|nr:dTDP-4-dehydrorhamnose 3,5-epimerase [Gammaproteobacteria bacterium]